MKWTAEADQKLLLLLISEVKKAQTHQLAARWAATYPNDSSLPTARALGEHIGKLKKNAGGGAAAGMSTPNATKIKSTPSTPSSTKHHIRNKTPSTSGKRKLGTMSEDDDDCDDDDENIDFSSVGKRTMPRRHAAAQRTRYTEEPIPDYEDELGIPKPQAIAHTYGIKSDGNGIAHDSAVEQPATSSDSEPLGRKSIARSKKNPRFHPLDASYGSESDDEFVPGL